MNKFEDFLLSIFSGVFVGTILLLPAIGMAFITIDMWWISIIFITLGFWFMEFYGRHFFKINKHIYKNETKLKIHHDVEKNFVWVESNDTIDSIIDIDIVTHVKLKE
jgi:ABC-type uncharacterized transport system fused permease/ATPase subunit